MQTLKENIRAIIIAEAGKEFSRFGFDKASMKVIAGKCSISVGTLYKYFPGKKELFDVVTSPGQQALSELSQCTDADTFSSIVHSNKAQLRLILLKGTESQWQSSIEPTLENSDSASELYHKMSSAWLYDLLKEIITHRHTKPEINRMVQEYLTVRNIPNQEK